MDSFKRSYSLSDPEKHAGTLDWREFESFAESIFESFGYKTVRNFRLKRPRLEMDLLAIGQNDISFGVDCKHWKRTVGESSMNTIALKQSERCRKVLENSQALPQIATNRKMKIVPLVLTWRDEMLHLVSCGAPIVPVHKLSNFLLNWEELREDLLIIDGSSHQLPLI